MAELVGLVASILQLVATAKSTIGVAIDAVNSTEQQRNLLTEIGGLEPLLKDLQTRLRGNPSVNGMRQLEKPLAQFEETMKGMTDRLRPSNKSKFRKALAWSFWKKKETKEDLNKLERFKALLNSYLVMDIWDVGQQQQGIRDDTVPGLEILKAMTDAVQGHHQEHDNILNKVSDAAHEQKQFTDRAERDEIIGWLSPLNFFSRNQDIYHARQEGTGKWLLDHVRFQEWVSSTGGTLWCYGMPGSGKTVLSSSLVTEFLLNTFTTGNIGVACVYLNHKETATQSPENILAGLWRQLIFKKCLHSGSPAHTLYDMHHEKRTRPTLEEMHTLLHSAVAAYSKVYIIIDALDEYPEVQRRTLLKDLAAFGSEFNLFLTSRPHIKPDTFFPNTPDIEIRATEEDIRRYTEAQIQKSHCLLKHVQSHPDLQQEIETRIISSVDGMFLLAKLRIDFLTTMNTVKAVRDTLKNLPEDLEQTYTEAMDRIESQNKEDKRIALLALTWVANAKRPLSVTELLEAIAIEPGTKSLDREGVVEMGTVLSVCAGLIIVDQDGTVRLIHYTTQKYLDDILNVWALEKKHALLEYSFQHGLIHAMGKPESMLQHLILEFLGQASRWNVFWNAIRFNPHSASSPWEFLDSFNDQPQFHTTLHYSALFNLQETFQNLLAQDLHLWDEKKGELFIISSSFGYVGMVELLLKKGVDVDVNLLDVKYGNSLRAASYHGNEVVIRLLIERGANVNAQSGEDGNALQAAVAGRNPEVVKLLIDNGADAALEGRNTEIVKLLIDNGADVNAPVGAMLQAASWWGNTDIVKLLIDKGADMNAQGGEHGNALQAAVAGRNTEAVKLLIDKGADVNAQGGKYGNALQAAVVGRNTEVTKVLIDNGANVNAQGGKYGNALQAASAEGYKTVVQLLINKGADVNAQGGEYGNALQAASTHPNTSTVQLLIDQGANVNEQGGVYGNALQAASYHGNEEVIQLLIVKGANVNAQGGEYDNALQAASTEPNTAIIHLLIDHGADVNQQSGMYGNALQAASYYGNKEIVRLLIKKGADVNAQGGKYGNALQAASTQPNTAIIQLLIDHGADVNQPGGTYGNALQAASFYGNEELVRLLIDKGVDVNAQGGKYGNSLQAASTELNTAIIQLLIDQGANVNEQGGIYGNALQAASYCGNKEIVRLLIEKGADVNAQGGKYGNALQAASTQPNTAIIQLLIHHGADVNKPGGMYGNALQAASRWGREQVVQLLIEKGANVNSVGGKYGHAIQAASAKGRGEIIKLLIENGVDVNVLGGKYGNSLQAASAKGHKAVIKLLIERGADLNATGGKYGSTFQAAVIKKHQAVVQLLIENGADTRLLEEAPGSDIEETETKEQGSVTDKKIYKKDSAPDCIGERKSGPQHSLDRQLTETGLKISFSNPYPSPSGVIECLPKKRAGTSL
ncbi:ankyrin repeat-containing domain protein [Mycena rebaudengoi]|nr:ankyrin repeat-containing domain protein [Mycena rebaudengoi]